MISRFYFETFNEKQKLGNLENCLKKCPYLELSCSEFSRIRTEYSVRMRENVDRNNSEYEHFYTLQNSTKTVIIFKYNFKNIWNGQTKPASQ